MRIVIEIRALIELTQVHEYEKLDFYLLGTNFRHPSICPEKPIGLESSGI